jgi:phage gp29-like protein
MLYDQYNREIKSNKPILDEVAVQTVRDRYGSYPSQGLTPQRLATIFKEADQGDVNRQAELFMEMEEKDLHLGGVLQTRKLAITGLDWEILPASESAEDKKIAEAAIEMIEYMENFEDMLLDMLDAVGKGFSVQEIMWDMSEGQVWIKETEWVNQMRFTFNSAAALLKTPKLITDAAPVWGEDLLPNKFILHKYKARSGATPRGGILRPCAYMYLFKNYGIKDWVIFNELFAVPMRVGKYKPGAGDKEKDALKKAVFNLGVDAAAVISDNSIIELVESVRRGDAGVLSSLPDFCDKAMSKGVLGHTGSAESTPGKLGGENASEAVRHDLVESDAKASMKTIKIQMLAPWVMFNYGPGKGVPIFKLHFEEGEDLEKIARTYGILVKDAGFTGIPVSHIHDRFNIPMPEKDEETLKAVQPSLSPFDFNPKPDTTNVANKLMVNSAAPPDWRIAYMAAIKPSLQNARLGALDEIESYLQKQSTPPTQAEFIASVQSILGAALSVTDRPVIKKVIESIYTTYRSPNPAAVAGFGGPDLRAMNFLSKVDNFYISKWVQNPDAVETVKSFLSERYLQDGEALFRRALPENYQAFRDLFGQKLSDLEDFQVSRIIDTSVTRAQNWAATAQLHEAGITELEIYEPTQECEFCQSMNGKVISVPTAYNTMTRQAGMTPDEYSAEMKTITPAVGNAEALVARGVLPPYHPHCHGIVIKRVR